MAALEDLRRGATSTGSTPCSTRLAIDPRQGWELSVRAFRGARQRRLRRRVRQGVPGWNDRGPRPVSNQRRSAAARSGARSVRAPAAWDIFIERTLQLSRRAGRRSVSRSDFCPVGYRGPQAQHPSRWFLEEASRLDGSRVFATTLDSLGPRPGWTSLRLKKAVCAASAILSPLTPATTTCTGCGDGGAPADPSPVITWRRTAEFSPEPCGWKRPGRIDV